MPKGNNQFTAPWTPEELDRLHTEYPKMFPEEIAAAFPGRTPGSVRNRATVQGIMVASRTPRTFRAFPSAEDGGYVSGLVDGEGYFSLGVTKVGQPSESYVATFGLSLREDDMGVLLWLKDYFGCGNICVVRRPNGGTPMAAFAVSKLYAVCHSVIPHFDKFPLRAKKKRNYEIWKAGVAVMQQTRCHYWTAESRTLMQGYRRDLKALAIYEGAA